jgi:protein kinase-like protein/PEGA domain-containing protein
MLHSDDPAEEIHPLTREDLTAFSPPPAFGPFRVLHQIGVGALGPVFRTYEPTRDRLIAVKVFRLDIVPEQAQALADELSRAAEAGLFHPSIVEPIAAGLEGTVAYRAEEYVAAESLDVAMRHYAPASIDKALPFITQLAGAIDFARAAGVGHGGLHPRDIFMTPDEARATGFGVVEALERIGIRAPVRRPYSAPERIAGAEWSTAADVFALGAISFELLTGRRPAGTGAQIGSLPAGAGEHAEAMLVVLARAMNDDPARRYGSALAFASALESAARGQSITDAVATVAAIAAVDPAPALRTRGPEPRVADLALREASAAPIVESAPIRTAPAPAPTPGEFEIEEQLDPLHTAIADEGLAEPALLNFEEVSTTGASRDDAFARDDEPDPLADDFIQAQQADADSRRPLEASYETRAEHVPVYTPVEPSYGADAPFEPESGDVPERSRPAVLPIAVTLVIGLLGGFAAGYFVRDRAAHTTMATAVSRDAGSPTGTSSADARQWSEQAVSKPPGAAPPTQAPRVPDESGGGAAAPASRRDAAPPARSAPAPAIARGQLVVRSSPSRAGVTINGRWRGRTPLTLGDLPLGAYVVRVVQDGYQVAREEVALTARSAERTLDVRLQRENRAAAAAPPATGGTAARTPASAPAPTGTTQSSFTGGLFVDSRPQGANVLLDGRNVGRTPLQLPGVPIGTHVVRIELAEHKPWFSTATVTAGEVRRVTGSLERFQ